MDGKSLDIAKDKQKKFKEILPEAFAEGKIDLEKLQLTLGEDVNIQDERYVLNWAGKSDAFRALQTPTTATLAPVKGESVNFDSTENVFIEGENLEVLKILQKAYYGKIKMIYIDPPYNTGNESFVYPDRFSETREEYLKKINDKDEEGLLLKEGLFRKNSKDSGHYHSNWLTMMYPRLFLARNLLKEDGVIFVSIDDNEVHNLRLLMNEIFGEANFVACIIWQKVFSPKNTAKYFSEDHDYILVYAKEIDRWLPQLLPRTDELDSRYKNPDNDSRGPWSSSDLTARNYYSQGQYEVTGPTGKKFSPGVGTYWRSNYQKFLELDKDGRIWWGNDGKNMPRLKRFLSEVKKGVVPQTLWLHKEVGNTQEAKKELLAHVAFKETENVLNTVKPTRLIKRMLHIATEPDNNDIILDFFAGSASTGHATIDQNFEDGGNRKFILVQFPEPLPKPEENLVTIADIGKERINAVFNKLCEENPQFANQNVDYGIKVFKLRQSNFKLWRGDGIKKPDELEKQLDMLADPVKLDALEVNMLFELLLKSGYPLSTQMENREVGKGHYYLVSEKLAIVLSDLDEAIIQDILNIKPQQVICLDSLFTNNDSLKTNYQLQFKDAGIEFHSI